MGYGVCPSGQHIAWISAGGFRTYACDCPKPEPKEGLLLPMNEWFTDDELNIMRNVGEPVPPEPDMDLIGSTMGGGAKGATRQELFVSFLIVCLIGAVAALLHSIDLLVAAAAIGLVLVLLAMATLVVWLFVFDRP